MFADQCIERTFIRLRDKYRPLSDEQSKHVIQAKSNSALTIAIFTEFSFILQVYFFGRSIAKVSQLSNILTTPALGFQKLIPTYWTQLQFKVRV